MSSSGTEEAKTDEGKNVMGETTANDAKQEVDDDASESEQEYGEFERSPRDPEARKPTPRNDTHVPGVSMDSEAFGGLAGLSFMDSFKGSWYFHPTPGTPGVTGQPGQAGQPVPPGQPLPPYLSYWFPGGMPPPEWAGGHDEHGYVGQPAAKEAGTSVPDSEGKPTPKPNPNLPPDQEYQVYSARWIMLLYMSLLNLLSDWTCYSVAPIALLTMKAFGDVDPESLVTVFLGANAIASAAEPAILGRLGLRRTVVFGAMLLMAGSIVKSGGAPLLGGGESKEETLEEEEKDETWRLYLGFFLVGLSQPLYQCTPALLSASWFPENERTMATGVALNSNQLGIGCAFVFGTMLVSTEADILPYFGLLSIVSTITFVGAALQFDDAPPTPPSDTARVIRGTLEIKVPTPGDLFKSIGQIGSGGSKDTNKNAEAPAPASTDEPTSSSAAVLAKIEEETPLVCPALSYIPGDDTANDNSAILTPAGVEEQSLCVYAAPSPASDDDAVKSTGKQDGADTPQEPANNATPTNQPPHLHHPGYMYHPLHGPPPPMHPYMMPPPPGMPPYPGYFYPPPPGQGYGYPAQQTKVSSNVPSFYHGYDQEGHYHNALLETTGFVDEYEPGAFDEGVEPVMTQMGHNLDIDVRDDQIWLSFKACFARRGFAHCVVAFTTSGIIINTLSTFMDYLVTLEGAGREYVGIVGGTFQLFIMVASLVFGGWTDHSRKYYFMILVMLVSGAFALAVCNVNLDADAGGDLRLSLLFVAVLAGPLQPLSTELGVEVVYPLSENTVLVIQQLFSNLLSAAFIPVFKQLRDVGTAPAESEAQKMFEVPQYTFSFYMLIIIHACSTAYFATFNGKYLRYEAELEKKAKKEAEKAKLLSAHGEGYGTLEHS